MEKLAKDFKERNQRLWFLNLNHKVTKAIKKLGDLSNLKILKTEAEIVALLCGLGKQNKTKNIIK